MTRVTAREGVSGRPASTMTYARASHSTKGMILLRCANTERHGGDTADRWRPVEAFRPASPTAARAFERVVDRYLERVRACPPATCTVRFYKAELCRLSHDEAVPTECAECVGPPGVGIPEAPGIVQSPPARGSDGNIPVGFREAHWNVRGVLHSDRKAAMEAAWANGNAPTQPTMAAQHEPAAGVGRPPRPLSQRKVDKLWRCAARAARARHRPPPLPEPFVALASTLPTPVAYVPVFAEDSRAHTLCKSVTVHPKAAGTVKNPRTLQSRLVHHADGRLTMECAALSHPGRCKATPLHMFYTKHDSDAARRALNTYNEFVEETPPAERTPERLRPELILLCTTLVRQCWDCTAHITKRNAAFEPRARLHPW